MNFCRKRANSAVKKAGKAFKGYEILEYAQRIGVGSMQYQLHTEE
jgi:uncharacterized Fe-S center protein